LSHTFRLSDRGTSDRNAVPYVEEVSMMWVIGQFSWKSSDLMWASNWLKLITGPKGVYLARLDWRPLGRLRDDPYMDIL
jgi:hypothetical protein